MLACRSYIGVVAALLTTTIALAGQVPPGRPDSTGLRQGRALCGRLADDTTVLDPFWPPAGSLVSTRFDGLQGFRLLPSHVGMEYPTRLRAQRIEGTVIVAAVVDTSGRVEPGSIKVVSTPHQGFVPVVEQFLDSVRFSPGQIHGRLMRVCVVMPFDFRLPGG